VHFASQRQLPIRRRHRDRVWPALSRYKRPHAWKSDGWHRRHSSLSGIKTTCSIRRDAAGGNGGSGPAPAATGGMERGQIAPEDRIRAGSRHLINGYAELTKRRKQGADNKMSGAACASPWQDSACRGSGSSGQRRALGTDARDGQAAMPTLPLLLRRAPERRRAALRGLRHRSAPRMAATAPSPLPCAMAR
jgi:hypothetical protein